MRPKSSLKPETALVKRALPQKRIYSISEDTAILAALQAWAENTTNTLSYRRPDLLRDKQNAVVSFFTFIHKHATAIKPKDCVSWRHHLEKTYKPNTIYARLSRLSSFYNWLLSSRAFSKHLRTNPVLLARPKCPLPYQAESSKSLTDKEMNRLLKVVKDDAEKGSVVGRRDYALLLLYFLSGLRRSEIISLRGKDIDVSEGSMIIKYRRKGGRYTGRELADSDCIAAVETYLASSGRTNVLDSHRPLWTRHDRAGKPGAPLTSHALVKNLKGYAEAAKLKSFHLHQTRHTFARIFAEDSGSMMETQEALDHANVSTTRAYVQRISIKKDKSSASVKRRLQ